jgi:hypothetical protein
VIAKGRDQAPQLIEVTSIRAPRTLYLHPRKLLFAGNQARIGNRGQAPKAAAQFIPTRGIQDMKFMQFWGDLSMWNKYGLCVVAAVVVLGLIFLILR